MVCGRETVGTAPVGENPWFSGIRIKDTAESTEERPPKRGQKGISHLYLLSQFTTLPSRANSLAVGEG